MDKQWGKCSEDLMVCAVRGLTKLEIARLSSETFTKKQAENEPIHLFFINETNKEGEDDSCGPWLAI